jgi:hypothetical protein
MQAFMFKEQVFCSNAYNQALTTKNEKSESSYANEAFRHKLGTKLILTSSFGPKSSLAPCSNPLYFLHAQFQVSSPDPAKLGVLVPSFNDFMDNSSALHILKYLVSFFS